MRLFNLAMIAALAPTGLCAAHGGSFAGGSSSSTVAPDGRRVVLAQSETHINQIHAPALRRHAPPEGALLGAQTGKGGGATGAAPAALTTTCTAANAATPDCYAATQQARPLAK
jgi:hypothetical protein